MINSHWTERIVLMSLPPLRKVLTQLDETFCFLLNFTQLRTLDHRNFILASLSGQIANKIGKSGLTSAVNYGNGLIQFNQKSFCSNDACNDVTVCQVLTSSGEKNYYIPVDGSLNEMKELVILYFA